MGELGYTPASESKMIKENAQAVSNNDATSVTLMADIGDDNIINGSATDAKLDHYDLSTVKVDASKKKECSDSGVMVTVSTGMAKMQMEDGFRTDAIMKVVNAKRNVASSVK